ncbi:hypothetical protein BX070DRAFT_250299 [Coemansia spiralis]|nr:hypothetical protein BX070DRAFT_250299 [Coemansia spiralis]
MSHQKFYLDFPDEHESIRISRSKSLPYIGDIWLEFNRVYLYEPKEKLQQLAGTWANSYYFPSVRRVIIEYGQTWDPGKILITTLPKVKKLHVAGIGHWDTHVPSYTNVSVGLTYLNFSHYCSSDLCSHIIKQNAATLNTLMVHLLVREVAQHLIFDEDGSVVTYPRLEILELTCIQYDVILYSHKVDKTVVPFPSLKRLCWKILYSFEDNTLFRENNNTLTYLSIEVDEKFRQVAQNYKIFYQGSHPNLRHIISKRTLIEYAYEYVDVSAELKIDIQSFVHFTLDLASSAKTFDIHSLKFMQELLPAIPEYLQMTNIQILKIPRARLTLSGAIHLLGLLPKLTYLESGL